MEKQRISTNIDGVSESRFFASRVFQGAKISFSLEIRDLAQNPTFCDFVVLTLKMMDENPEVFRWVEPGKLSEKCRRLHGSADITRQSQ
jgi:hypothetical protein